MSRLISDRARRTGRAVALAATACLLLAAAAQAGAYHVYACRTPLGQPAPTDGWSGSTTGPDTYALDTCAQPGGALVAALGDHAVHAPYADAATWTFTAPPGERIAAATLARAGDTAGGGGVAFSYEFWLAGPLAGSIFEECVYALGCAAKGEVGQPASPQDRVAVPVANLGSSLYLGASCAGMAGKECAAGSGDASGYAAAVYLYAADLELEQSAAPSATNVTGELASAATVAGEADVAFTASDAGSGVFQALIAIDGRLVQRSVIDEDGGRCREAGQGADGLPAFLYLRPCPASVSAAVPFDTTALVNGRHHLVVSVLDAAGNSAVVLDREIEVANQPRACRAAKGRSASAQAVLAAGWKRPRGDRKRAGATLTSAYGRAQLIRGRLTRRGGAPVAGAPIDLVEIPASLGGKPATLPSARTGPDGRFSVRVPAGASSQTVCLAYRPPGAGSELSRRLALRVRAGISLGVAPAVTAQGQTITFNGRLLGGPIPPAGKQLVLEARSPGGPWLQFRVVRSDARGRFRAGYRFRFPGPAAYQFRAISEVESDYPFAAGASNVVGVRER